jgi:hypothetical protein
MLHPRRTYIACKDAIHENRFISRIRQLFSRVDPKTSGHGGFCYLPDGELFFAGRRNGEEKHDRVRKVHDRPMATPNPIDKT